MPHTGVFSDPLRRGYLQLNLLSRTFNSLPGFELFLDLAKLFNYHQKEHGLLELGTPLEVAPLQQVCDVMLDTVVLLAAIEDTIQGKSQDLSILFSHPTTPKEELEANFEQHLNAQQSKTPAERMNYYTDVLIEHLYLNDYFHQYQEKKEGQRAVSSLMMQAKRLCGSIESRRLQGLKKCAKIKANELHDIEVNEVKQHTRGEIRIYRDIAKQIYEKLISFGTTLLENELQKIGYTGIQSELIVKQALRQDPKQLVPDNDIVSDLYRWLSGLSDEREQYFDKPKQFISRQYETIVDMIKVNWPRTTDRRGLLRLASSFSFDSDNTKKCHSILEPRLQHIYTVSEDLFKFYFKFYYNDSPATIMNLQRSLFRRVQPNDNEQFGLATYQILLGELFTTKNIADLQTHLTTLANKQSRWRIYDDQAVTILAQCEYTLVNQ